MWIRIVSEVFVRGEVVPVGAVLMPEDAVARTLVESGRAVEAPPPMEEIQPTKAATPKRRR